MFTLHTILRFNAVSCLSFGLLFAILPTQVGVFLGGVNTIPTWVLLLLAASLIINSAHLFWASFKTVPSKQLVQYFSIGDFIWVIGTVALILFELGIKTSQGLIASLSVAVFVGMLGVLQLIKRNTLETGQQFKPFSKWTIRLLCTVVTSVFTVLLLGGVYQTSSFIGDTNQLKPPGQMLSLGDKKLYVHCTGASASNSTRPTIFLENGMGVVSENWDWVQQALSKEHRVCAYDRAGTGYSEAIREPVNAKQSAKDLAKVLIALDIDEPVILVGHSYGGLIARVFTHEFPEKVAGLVLVDSSHEDMAKRFPMEIQAGFEDMLNSYSMLGTLNYFSGAIWMGVAGKFSDGLAGPSQKRAYSLYASTHHMQGAANEAKGWYQSAVSARKVAKTGLGDIPLAVLMVDNWPEIMLSSWRSMQTELATLSTKGQLIEVTGADHFQVLGEARYAMQVVEAVEAVVKQTNFKPL